MPHMRGIIHGRPARVPSDMTIFHRHEWFLLAREGVAHEELARRDGVGGVDFGGLPWVTVGVAAARGLAEVAGSGERHGGR